MQERLMRPRLHCFPRAPAGRRAGAGAELPPRPGAGLGPAPAPVPPSARRAAGGAAAAQASQEAARVSPSVTLRCAHVVTRAARRSGGPEQSAGQPVDGAPSRRAPRGSSWGWAGPWAAASDRSCRAAPGRAAALCPGGRSSAWRPQDGPEERSLGWRARPPAPPSREVADGGRVPAPAPQPAARPPSLLSLRPASAD